MSKQLFYIVPSADIRAHLETSLKATVQDLAYAQNLNELYRVELEQKALPALQQEYDRLVKIWETAPPEMKRRKRKPTLNEYPEEIITYKKRTLWRMLADLITWGISDRDRWFVDEWIHLNNLYEFKNERVSTRKFSDRIFKLKRKIREFERDCTEELTEYELKEIGLNPTDYQCVRRKVRD